MNPALQNRDMYGAINDQNHFPTYPNKEQEPEPTYTIAKIIGIFFLVGSLAALAVTDNFVLKQSSSASLKKSKTSTTDDINWSIYKHTTSVTTGTYTAVNDFVATYITYVSDIVDLGCSDSMKVVGSIAVPSEDTGMYGFEEIHWVDSSVFPQSGLSIGEWSDYVASMGVSEYNTFMYNKVQLYVPDLSAHYASVVGDKINSVLRLSKSAGSSSYDTAHIGIPVFQAANMYEIVGPSSSLTSDQLEAFGSWSDSECPEAHNLVYSLDELSTLYGTISFSDGQKNWTTTTGKYVPMGVGIIIPASSIEYISDTVSIITDVTGGTSTTQTGLGAKGGCSITTINIGDGTHFEPAVRYVANSEVAQGTTFTISDWEQAVALTHQTYLNKSAEFDQWDRYLDTHVGILSNYGGDSNDDTLQCEANENTVETALQESSQQPTYSMRDSEGLHYYVGTTGVKCWEFNAFGCSSTESDICGCIASNNNNEYMDEYDGAPCGSSRRKEKK